MAHVHTMPGARAMPAAQRTAEVEAAARVADPAPLGLAAFALTTFVLSVANAGLIGASSIQVVLGLALFYGGLAQLLAGMWEFRNGNTFGATAFSSYGAFWLSFAAFSFWFAPGLEAADRAGATGTFLLAWGIFTAYMWIASLRHAPSVMIVFLLLTVTFFVLSAGDFAASEPLRRLGGYLGIATAFAAWYASAAAVIDEAFGRPLLPR